MSSSSTVLTIELRCESREYEKQRHANGRGKQELHSVVVPGHHMTERNPNARTAKTCNQARRQMRMECRALRDRFAASGLVIPAAGLARWVSVGCSPQSSFCRAR